MVRQHHHTIAATTTNSAATSTLLTPPKRKKGRPSLHDLQQRNLFQQQQQLENNHQFENPNSLPRRARSSRRTSNNLPAQFLLGSDSDSDTPHSHSDSDSDSQDERTSKKVRRLPSAKQVNNDVPVVSQSEKGSKATDTHNETKMVFGPTNGSTSDVPTALPDRQVLLSVLDRLQKKDTRGVFAEPVDPEELPDYHEVIDRPMDFGTVREQLDRGHYMTMEQFEDDIFLICSNAMQYNLPYTIFFRQARSIQELAKKEFDVLRQDAGQIELPPKPRRGRPPGSKNQKKPVECSSIERGISESPSDATPASKEDDATRSGSYNLRKGPSLYRFPRSLENSFDFSASPSRFSSTKYGKKQPGGSDESRRETYGLPSQFCFDQGSSAAYRDPEKQLIPVGLSSDHGYARSLVRFAVGLGPVVWGIVSKKLKAVLPPGVEFGPGWIDEKKASSTQLSPLTEKAQPNHSPQDTLKRETLKSLTSGFTNPTFNDRPSASCRANVGGGGEQSSNHEWSSLKCTNGLMGPPGSSYLGQAGPLIYPQMDGFSFGPSSQFQEGMSRPISSPFLNPSPSSFDASTSAIMNRMQSPPDNYHGILNPETDIGVLGAPYWQNLSMQERWDRPYSVEPNGGFLGSGSRNPSLAIGSPPQVDLVLQL